MTDVKTTEAPATQVDDKSKTVVPGAAPMAPAAKAPDVTPTKQS